MSTDTVDEVAAEGSDVLRITDLNVRFATDSGTVNAVEDVSLEVGDREVVAIVGESGSGKSVTARSILGLLSDTASEHGAVVLRSHSGGETTDVVGLSSSRLRRIRGADAAMVFQEPSTTLNPVFTVGWQIAEGLRAHGKYRRAELRRRSVEMLKLVGIPDPERRVNDYPHQFSGGQKQRIVIAMALSLNPGLIIADEPTTALDVTVQAEILGLLRRCREEMGASIILITHNMGVVADLSDRVVVMYQGRIVESNEVHELFAHPQHEYTKALLAAVPRIGRHPVREVVDQDGDPVVTARDLRIEYPGRLGRPGFQAVRGIDLELRPGEVLGLVGESGSGKTTIGRAIAGLTPVSGGSLTVLGHEMLGIRERRFRSARRDLGFVFQDPASSFDPQLTIGDCIAEPLVVHGVFRDAAAARGRVEELLAEVQLPGEYANRIPTSCRAASVSGSAWHARSAWIRHCSSPTNPPALWTSRCRRRCSTCSGRCRTASTSPACSSLTILGWWIRWPTAWRCSMRDGSSRWAPRGRCSPAPRTRTRNGWWRRYRCPTPPNRLTGG